MRHRQRAPSVYLLVLLIVPSQLQESPHSRRSQAALVSRRQHAHQLRNCPCLPAHEHIWVCDIRYALFTMFPKKPCKTF